MSETRHVGPGPDITQSPSNAQPMTGHPVLEARVRTQIAGMTAPQHAAATRAQDQLAAILQGLQLKSPDPGVRLSMARHIAGLHPELGIAPQAITLADVTDRGLAEHLAAVMALKDHLAPAAKPSIGGKTMPNDDVRYLGVIR